MSRVATFFCTFRIFLSFDAVGSLTALGRSRNIVNEFYKFFSLIPTEISDEIFDKQYETILKLLYELRQNSSDIQVVNIISYVFEDSFFAPTTTNKEIGKRFREFLEASESYKKHRKKLSQEELKKIYLKSVAAYFERNMEEKSLKKRDTVVKIIDELIVEDGLVFASESMLKQGLMEFFNALSHLNMTTYVKQNKLTSADKQKAISNIERAGNHLMRGTLDFFKAILKEIIFLEKVDNEFIQKFKEIREKEYGKIGNSQAERICLIEEYKVLIDAYLGEN